MVALQKRFAQGKLPHALLLAGPGGTGKRAFAHAFGTSLLCEQRDAEGHPCGACVSCRLIAAGTHPDLHLIRPPLLALAEGNSLDSESAEIENTSNATEADGGAKTKASAEISVAQVRSLGDALSIAAHRGGLRVALIYPADAMNGIAANALLKTLEEPGERVIFLLISDAPHRLLPTIRSRCQIVPMPVPQKDIALTWLAEQGGATAEQLAMQGGAPVRAAELASSSYWIVQQALADALAQGAQIDAIATARMLEAEIRRQDREAQAGTPRTVDMRVAIGWLQHWMHDAIRLRLTQTIGYHQEASSGLKRVAELPLARLLAFYAWLNEAARQAGHPVNAQLFLEDSLLRYRTLFDASLKPV